MSQPVDRSLRDLWRVRANESSFYSPEPGLQRRILAHNDNMMLVEHRMEANWKGLFHRRSATGSDSNVRSGG